MAVLRGEALSYERSSPVSNALEHSGMIERVWYPRPAGPGRARFAMTLEPLRYRGTSLIRNSAPLGPYSNNVPRALWRPYGGVCFL